jgi:tetratricopeptide (TPR) repeat protein
MRLQYSNALGSMIAHPDVPLPEARALASEVIAVSDAVHADGDEELLPKMRVALALVTLGQRLDDAGEEVAALTAMRDGVRHLQELEERFPARVELRANLASAALNLAQLLRTRDLLDEASGVLEDAAAVARRLVENFGARAEFHALLGSLSMVQAECLHDLGDDSAAIAAHERAAEAFEAALALAPGEPTARSYVGANDRVLASLLIERGDVDGARAAIRRALARTEEAVRLAPEQAWNHLELAEARLVVARHALLLEEGETALALARGSFDAAVDALASEKTADFAGCARESAALVLALGFEDAQAASGEAAAAIVQRLIDLGAATLETLRDSPEFATIRDDPRLLEVLARFSRE